MNQRARALAWAVCVSIGCGASFLSAAEPAAGTEPAPPAKVYVPYDQLKDVFETEKQGVFLPYEEFQKLWRAAKGAPAGIQRAPAPYLISTARFTGKVGGELASVTLQLTVDILADGWVEVPIGLGDVAVSAVRFEKSDVKGPQPLLRVVDGQYRLLTKGKGRRVLTVDFVRQLVTQPGLNVLGFRIPASAITTLELTIPEENMKVDVEPMLAASTEQMTAGKTKATRLQAFLGSARTVKLSWKPKTQAAAELAPVVISEQLQHIHVAEALISHDVTFTYDIRRRGVDSLTVQLPGRFRVTGVEGANISKWDIAAAGEAQNLTVELFSSTKGRYALTVKMELFLKDPNVKLPLSPIVTQQVLRRTGLVAITHSPRRSVELTDSKNLARVDTGRLPKELRSREGATAWRFITADYGGELAIGTVAPRITANHFWLLGADDDRLELRGQLNYTIERTGVFWLTLKLPDPWEIVSLGPAEVVDDHQVSGEGRDRVVKVLLKREMMGPVKLQLAARAPRGAADEAIDFALPLADAENLRLYSGQVVLLLADRLRAEVESLQQLQSLPLNRAAVWMPLPGLSPAMAFEFRSIDQAAASGAKFTVAVKPTQVSAVVHRLVNVQPGSIQEQALVDYQVRYAPVDTFYLKMPPALADAGVRIDGPDIKERPRIEALPVDQQPAEKPETAPPVAWAYYKIVLQSPVIGRYRLTVDVRRSFQAGSAGQAGTVEVLPILAAGNLSDQIGYIAVVKADTLAIGEAKARGLTPGDPSSAVDVPEASHRGSAMLAYRYNAPPFALSLPVAVQKEAAVFTTMATGAIVEQLLGRNGDLNTHVTLLLDTSRGDRLPLKLPAGAKLFSVLLNGAEAPVEAGATADDRIVRLPPSAGEVSKLVLQVHYQLTGVSGRQLRAIELPEDIPVQKTLWRLRVPQEDRLLWYDKSVFARSPSGRRELEALAADYPPTGGFRFDDRGRAWDFVRQGPPGVLKVWTAPKEAFSIAVWVGVLLIGLAALKLGWFERCALVLAAGVAAMVAQLFAPLLVRALVETGFTAGAIVVGFWVAHWVFKRIPSRLAAARQGGPTPPSASRRLEPTPTPEPPIAPPPFERPPGPDQPDEQQTFDRPDRPRRPENPDTPDKE